MKTIKGHFEIQWDLSKIVDMEALTNSILFPQSKVNLTKCREMVTSRCEKCLVALEVANGHVPLILMVVVLMASLKSFSSNVVLIFGDERLLQSPALTEKGGENVLLFLAWVKGSPDYTNGFNQNELHHHQKVHTLCKAESQLAFCHCQI